MVKKPPQCCLKRICFCLAGFFWTVYVNLAEYNVSKVFSLYSLINRILYWFQNYDIDCKYLFLFDTKLQITLATKNTKINLKYTEGPPFSVKRQDVWRSLTSQTQLKKTTLCACLWIYVQRTYVLIVRFPLSEKYRFLIDLFC